MEEIAALMQDKLDKGYTEEGRRMMEMQGLARV